MRRPGPIVIVALLAVVGAVVAFAEFAGGGGTHPPESEEDIVVAAYAQAYVRALELKDVTGACRIATGEAAKDLHCDSDKPRVERTCGRSKTEGVRIDATTAEVRLDGCDVQLVAGELGWLVASARPD